MGQKQLDIDAASSDMIKSRRGDKMLFDINEVCNMLGTTSRTLRFYEEKGIISSTKEGVSSRRKYTKEQIDRIRNVLVLRTLGLSVKAIKELQSENSDLKSAVLARRAEIFAWAETKRREIELLNEALAIIDSGEDIFKKQVDISDIEKNIALLETARICAAAICDVDYKTLAKYCSKTLTDYMPESAFTAMMRDTLAPIGSFIGFESPVPDANHSNIIYQNIRYEKMGLRIKFVFHNGKIDGLWTTYYEV